MELSVPELLAEAPRPSSSGGDGAFENVRSSGASKPASNGPAVRSPNGPASRSPNGPAARSPTAAVVVVPSIRANVSFARDSTPDDPSASPQKIVEDWLDKSFEDIPSSIPSELSGSPRTAALADGFENVPSSVPSKILEHDSPEMLWQVTVLSGYGPK